MNKVTGKPGERLGIYQGGGGVVNVLTERLGVHKADPSREVSVAVDVVLSKAGYLLVFERV